MSNTYYVKLKEITEKDVKTLKGTKPADKVMFFVNEDDAFNVDELLTINGIAGTLEFVKMSSEADLYFYLGMNFQGSNKPVFLSGIHVPESIIKAVNGGAEKKKRAPRKTKNNNTGTTVKTAELKNEPIKSFDSAMNEPEESTADGDSTGASQKTKGIDWMSDGSAKYFSDYCGLPADEPNREEIVDFAALAFSECSKVSQAIEKIAEKYNESVAEFFKKNASGLVVAFNNAAFKRVDV